MVYILEDDTSILELVLYALKSQNIKAQGFSNVEDFNNAIKKLMPKIVILDIMLPNADGFEILHSLKLDSKTKNISVLLLTALNSEVEKVKGLDLGADDYITKPFGVMELLARVRVMLRRKEQNKQEITLDGLEFSHSKHEARLNGEELKLTLKEFELLGFLLENPNRAFSRDEMMEILWEHSNALSRTLDIHINTLRQKLGAWGKRIETIHSVGYKLKC